MKKTIITIVIALLVVVAVGYELHQSKNSVGAISPTPSVQIGDNFSQTSIAPSATTSSSTSIFNNSYDRAITQLYAYCTNASSTLGNALAFTMTVSTSSIASFNSTTATIATLTISSSTPQTYATSSAFTAGAGYWPANTWLQFNFNATNTATCAVGDQQIQL